MLNNAIFLGIASSAGRRPYTFVALDSRVRVLAWGNGTQSDVLAFAAGQSSALAAVSPPARAHLEAQGEQTDFQPGLGFTLPADQPAGPAWLRSLSALIEQFQALDYRPFFDGEASRQWLAVHAETAYASLLGRSPLPAGTLEGRMQRQLALFEDGEERLDLRDPMDFFEEITRFKLLRGTLPVESILTQLELEAMMAAYTAWLAVNRPARLSRREEAFPFYIPTQRSA